MNTRSITRRRFLQNATVACAGTAALGAASLRAADSGGVRWPIGCFNRPWTKWSYDETLDAIRDAGYKLTGLLSRQQDEAFIMSEATPEYLASLKKRIRSRGLEANMAAIRTRHNVPLEESIKEARAQIDNSARLDLRYCLSFGVNKAEEFEHYYKVMADAAAHAEKRGIQLVLKPHGGGSGASEEILRCIEKVSHPNFKIWYDAGNIIHYTGKDPVAELKPVAKHVTGFCAKDCAEPKGSVMIQFGEGKVDFKAVFAVLKTAGYNGPVMVESCRIGTTPAETADNARKNREFLEKVFASL